MAEDKTKDVAFEDLIGEHVLDAVDTFIEKVNRYGDYDEDANAIRFRLDGVVYTAVENPADGYRSSMERLFASPDAKMVNTFPGCRVLVRMKPDGSYSVNDTLEMIDLKTRKVVLEVGTDNSDDYYPCFVSAFWPENMAANTGSK